MILYKQVTVRCCIVVVFLLTDYYSIKLVYAVIVDVVLCRPITVLFLHNYRHTVFIKMVWNGTGVGELVTINIFSVN